ncbi:MAG: dihydroxyacetone kinase subunit DhaL [Atribacterota bacterium]
MNTCLKEELFKVLEGMCRVIVENEEYLNNLDSVIGDAEHGSNLKKAMEEALRNVQASEENSFELIESFGKAMIHSGCGSGPLLFGIVIRTIGHSLKQLGSFSPSNVAQALREALDEVKAKGNSKVGDKTMVDALEPAVYAFEQTASQGKSLLEAFNAATKAAKQGMLSTIALVGKRGRGSYLGERGVGHQDPGATSVYILFKCISQILARKE